MIKAFENKKYFATLNASELTLAKLPKIINQAYLDGVDDMDALYRNVLLKACDKFKLNKSGILLLRNRRAQ